MNIFIEGIQGSGKTTLIKKLSKDMKSHKTFFESDYNPLELAWCSYLDKEQYNKLLIKYPCIKDLTHKEDQFYVVPYTKTNKQDETFYLEMEQYEIYNGRVSFQKFKEILFRRFKNYQSNDGIFECSIFQNVVETMLLFYQMTEEEVVKFYQELKEVMNFNYRMLYIDSDHIRQNFLQAKKERVNEDGHEMWFKFMMNYFTNSPYAKTHNLTSIDDLISYFELRRKVEKKILSEVFKDSYQILESKQYSFDEVFTFVNI